VSVARPTADPAFAPEPITDTDLAAWYARISATAGEMIEHLQRRFPDLPDHVQTKASDLIAARERILDAIRKSCTRTLGTLKTRIHGNLHLQKILLVADDFLITDFDGDMTRSPAERREKMSPMRDVATLLRSIAYARASALERAVSTRPDLLERAAPAFVEWEQGMRAAFLQGYRRGLGDARVGIELDSAACLLRLFQIERALQDVEYELKHRPAWLSVPLDVLLKLIED
jgi:maltose alpha-D-glucosyltransferase/alpha-amylase